MSHKPSKPGFSFYVYFLWWQISDAVRRWCRYHLWPHCIPMLYNGPPLPPHNCPFSWRDVDLHLIHGSLGSPESSTQTASRSVQPFLHGSLLWQTDRQTDHATQSVTIGRMYVRSTAMWANNTSTSDNVYSAFIGRVHPVHLMNAHWALDGHQPSDQANQLGLWVHLQAAVIQPRSWYSFYRPTEGRRLSRPS